MNDEVARLIARSHYDHKGVGLRRGLPERVLSGVPNAAGVARDLVAATGRVLVPSWVTPRESNYSYLFFGDQDDALVDFWTSRTWRQKSDESDPVRTGSSIGTGPYVPICRNLAGGLDWHVHLLPVVVGVGVVAADFPGGGIEHYHQQSDFLLELLDAAGATIKTAQTQVTWAMDVAAGVATSDYLREPWTFDGDGPVAEFWQFRASMSLRDGPVWASALNNDLFVGLEFLRGRVR